MRLHTLCLITLFVLSQKPAGAQIDLQSAERGLPSSELFDLLEPNYFLTSLNFTPEDGGDAPFFQPNNQVRFRVALRYRVLGAPRSLLNWLFGDRLRPEVYDTGLHLGYIQNSFWNLWSDSSPFVDNNYSPRLFLYVDGLDVFDPYNYKWYSPSLRLSLDHESNGLSGPESRSWNRLTATVELGDSRLQKMYGSISFWAVLNRAIENRDIAETNGRGEITVYFQPFLQNRERGLDYFGVSVTARVAGRRAVANVDAAVYWNPFYDPDGTWSPTLMAQLFCGTGQYLLDHHLDECAFRTGIAIIH